MNDFVRPRLAVSLFILLSLAGATATLNPTLIIASVAVGCLAAAAMTAAMVHQRRRQLVHCAHHDELTDLPTRQLLLGEIERRLSAAEAPLALLFIDLDRFKTVNDLMGHQAGDELLIAVAERLVATTRDTDLVARISGDEFVVLAAGIDGAGAARLADRIRLAFDATFVLREGPARCTASIGISTAAPGDAITASQLIRDADTAMYESKRDRDRTTVFDSSMQERATRRSKLEQLLRDHRSSEPVTASFQPIIDVSTGRVEGFEALMRWEAFGESVSPAEFVPIAEESGLMHHIGADVLDQACAHLARWRHEIDGAENLYVSVNLSARQVASSDIVDVVATSLERHGLPPGALWLEITEKVMQEDASMTASSLTGLRDLGVGLALDDFGTGESSLSGLQWLPVDRIKIDRRFISGLGTESTDDKLVRCITAVAESFELEVVAEGVETDEQLDALRADGCHVVQGFLFSGAVVAADVPAVFAALDRYTESPPEAGSALAAPTASATPVAQPAPVMVPITG